MSTCGGVTVDETERYVLRIAATQFGVVSREQALQKLSPDQIERRVRRGAWERLYPGAYRIEGSPRGWKQHLKALSLSVREGFALSHDTAATLLGLRGFDEGPIVISVNRCLRLPPPVEAHRVQAWSSRDLNSIQGFRLTNATRTLLDLSAAQPFESLKRAADDALGRRLTTVDRLANAVAGAAGRRGAGALRELVRLYQGGDGPTESELESRVLEVIDAAGLPLPRCQRAVRAGGRVRRLDFLFDVRKVVIEADGDAHHASPESFERDRQRSNSLTAQGYLVLHWTWRALHERPEALLAELRAALGVSANPWSGKRPRPPDVER
jgi:very-short-patch-repair endonuclease